MTQQILVGTPDTDGVNATGKINANFQELYGSVSATPLYAPTFGILPANTDVQNDVGFAALKAKMLTSGTTTWRVYFPPGAYTYTNNRWLFGVQKVIIDAYDCTFQCTASGSDIGFLQTNDYFTDYGNLAFPGTGVYTSGYLINTAAAGAASITTTTHSDAGNFTPGMRVVLHGYDQQGAGYPPNPRYFEYLTVATANASTGVVTFTDQLQNAYDSRWWDTANYVGTAGFGAPRILSLDRTNYTKAKLMWFKGFTILHNPNGRTTPQIPGADLCILEDLSGPCFNVVMTSVCIIRRCNFTNQLAGDLNSGDKLVDRLVIENSLLDGTALGGAFEALDDCVGCNSVSLIRTKFVGSVNISPRSLAMDDCDVMPAAGNAYPISSQSAVPIRAVNIANTRAFNTGGVVNGWSNVGTPGFSLTVGTVIGNDIRITFDATGKTVAHQIDYGMTLTNTITGNTGKITAIYYETGSPGTLRIAGTWGTPTAADVFHYYDVMQAYDGGGNVVVPGLTAFWRGPPGPSIPPTTVSGDITANSLQLLTSKTTGNANSIATDNGNRNSVQHVVNGTLRMTLSAFGLDLAPGIPLVIEETGGAAAMGLATLVGGTVTVNTTLASSTNSEFLYARRTAGGTLGHLSITAISNGNSFTIGSSSGTDTSTVAWLIVNKT